MLLKPNSIAKPFNQLIILFYTNGHIMLHHCFSSLTPPALSIYTTGPLVLHRHVQNESKMCTLHHDQKAWCDAMCFAGFQSETFRSQLIVCIKHSHILHPNTPNILCYTRHTFFHFHRVSARPDKSS